MSNLPDYILETTYQGTTKNATFNGHTLVIKEYRIPFVVPSGTITLQFSDSSYDPTSGTWAAGSYWHQVSSSPNVWEYTHTTSSWLEEFKNKFTSSSNLVSIIGFNTSGITTLESAFEGCTALNSIDLVNLRNITTINKLFKGCTRLTTIPLLDTSHIEHAGGLFEGCTALTTVPLLDMSSNYDASGMFKGCTALTSLPLFDFSQVTDMSEMCMGCTALEEVPLFQVSSSTNMNNAFNGCINVEDGAYDLYSRGNTVGVTNHTDTFTNCGSNTVTGQADLNRIPTEWGGNYVVVRDIYFNGAAQIPSGSITSDIPLIGGWRLRGSSTGTITPRAGDIVHVLLYMSDMPENWYATSFKVMFGSHEVTVSKISGTNNWEGVDSFTISSAIGTPYVKQNYSIMFNTSGYLNCTDSNI